MFCRRIIWLSPYYYLILLMNSYSSYYYCFVIIITVILVYFLCLVFVSLLFVCLSRILILRTAHRDILRILLILRITDINLLLRILIRRADSFRLHTPVVSFPIIRTWFHDVRHITCHLLYLGHLHEFLGIRISIMSS